MNTLEISGLQHTYDNGAPILQDVNLSVPEGSIYGFLGPNGAGKSTTMKLILGILKVQQGDIKIFSKPLQQHRKEILYNIGSLIETPSIYGNLTAYENLLALQTIYQCPVGRIDEVLGLVDLRTARNKKAGKFSLGMKQRLAIAGAFLHQPKLLILDEPTNGLDINGIVEMRTLLKKINADNKTTIFISSHILSEIEKLADHIGVIKGGKMIYEGKLDDLSRQHSAGKQRISLSTSDLLKTLQILSNNNYRATLTDGKVTVDDIDKEQVSAVVDLIRNNDMELYGMDQVRNDLESVIQGYFNN